MTMATFHACTPTTCTDSLYLDADVITMKEEVFENRRWFHTYPEMAFKEVNTAAHVAATLRSYGITDITEGVGRTGVVGLIHGGLGDGECIALRADMDALPIDESSDKPYCSKNAGVMHACGHDGHMASLLCTAKLLQSRRMKLRGSVKLIFQPAEERCGGAREMIKDGVLDGVDRIFGIHLWSYSPVGMVSVSDGPVMAASDYFTISMDGRGGHGAHPHGTVDAIVMAGSSISSLQSIVSRNIAPLDDPAVVTIGTINGGYGSNIIADKVTMTGTVRTFHKSTQDLIKRRISEVCNGIADAHGGTSDIEYIYGYPATDNHHPESVSVIRNIAGEVCGADRSSSKNHTCGAEDFSYYLNAIKKDTTRMPGAFFFVGCALPGEERPHHKSCFDIDEDALLVSATMFLRLVDYYLGDLK